MKKSKHIFILLQRYFDAQLKKHFLNNDELVKGGGGLKLTIAILTTV